MTGLRGYFRRLRRDDQGAALVEFGMVLPVMLVMFGLTIEAGRTFWSYQATIAGVRDATRYVGRSEQTGVCNDASPTLSGWNAKVTDIVRNASDGTALFPSTITVGRVTADLTCVTGNYRLAQVPMATITAELQITYPFAGLFALVGVGLPTVDTVVTDTGRIFGA